MTELEKELLDEVYRDMEYYNNDFSLDKLPHIEAQKKVYNFLESIVDHFGTSDYDFVFAITKLEERHGKFLLPYLFEVLDNYINYPDAFRQDVAYAAYQNISLHYRRYFLINEMIVFLKGPYIEAFYEDFPYALNVLGDYALMENMHDKMLLINQAMLRNVESFKEKKPSYFQETKFGYPVTGYNPGIKIGVVTSTCALFEKLFILGLLGKENPQKESNKEEVHLENYSIERLIDFIRINDSYVMDYSLANEENLNLAKEYVQEAIQVNSKYAKYRYLQAQIIFYSKLFHKEEIDFDTFKTIKELLSLAKALENPKANDYEMRVNTYEQFGSYVRSYIEKGGVYSKTDLKLIKMKDEMLRYQVCPPPQYRIPPTARPGENYVFVSYSTKDFKSVYCDLISFASRGISFWYDAEVIPGEKWQSPVEEKIQGASCVICYLSENSLKSDAIYKEMELIKKYKKQVIWIDLTGKKQISKIIMHVMRDYPLEISSAITSDMLRSITELVDDNIDIISRDKDPRAEIHINRIEDVLQKKFSCTLKQIQSEHLSVANNKKDENQKLFKPNEDYVIDDQENHIYIVLDGISRKAEEYHNFHSLSADVSEIFAKEIHSYLLKNKKDVVKFSNVSIMLKDGFKQANHAVQIYLEAHQEEWVGKEIPGCVGIVTLLINQTLFYGSLGDCVGVLCRGDQKIVFSKKQTEFAFRYLNLETDRKRLYDEIVNQPQAPYGYGVINGNPCAVKYFDIGYLKIEKGDIVYLMSDGVSDYIEYNKVKTYKYQSLPHIIQGSNRQDEEMMKPYFDDKSIIKITLDNKAMALER